METGQNPKPEMIAKAMRLANWADAVEQDGQKTSIYYRLLPQIIEARAVRASAGAQI